MGACISVDPKLRGCWPTIGIIVVSGNDHSICCQNWYHRSISTRNIMKLAKTLPFIPIILMACFILYTLKSFRQSFFFLSAYLYVVCQFLWLLVSIGCQSLDHSLLFNSCISQKFLAFTQKKNVWYLPMSCYSVIMHTKAYVLQDISQHSCMEMLTLGNAAAACIGTAHFKSNIIIIIITIRQ